MSENTSIPLHSLTDRTNLGLEIHRVDRASTAKASLFGIHRDDHHIFLFQQEGNGKMMVDFREINFEDCVAFCVLPGQVHRMMAAENSSGWLLATDLSLLDDTYRSVFEEYGMHASPVPVNPQRAEMLHKSLLLLQEMVDYQQGAPFQTQMLRSLTQVCTGTFASIFYEQKKEDFTKDSRPVKISNKFKSLVVKNYKSMKSPAEYAGLLNITSSYLNEVVKNITGFSATYWIQYEVILEAKRLLCYTDLTVKEISFELGYDDPAYFSRLYHKVTAGTPLTFRKQYRK